MIEVKNLTRAYSKNIAVDNISFTVENGKIYGFLGPNGAGKSTTMNMICGCLSVTDGEITIEGHDIFKEPEKAKKCIGYLPEIPPLYPDMTPYEYLTFVAQAKGTEKKDIKNKVEKAVEKTGLSDMKDRLIKNLSKGYRQRVGIAQAIVADPEIVILDEPTVGLDPIQVIEVRELIKNLKKEHTVIISSHILSEIQAVCDSVIIINKGKIIASDEISNLENIINDGAYTEATVKADEGQVREILPGAEITSSKEGFTSFRLPKKECGREKVAELFAEKRIPVTELKETKADLEDIFVELTEKEEK